MTLTEIKSQDWSKYGILLTPEQILSVIDWNEERGLLNSFSFEVERNLMREENFELAQGIYKTDSHEVVDAINDMQVVFIGTVVKYLLNGLNPEESYTKEQVKKYIMYTSALLQTFPLVVSSLGYEPTCAFNETLLEIHSRVGSVNPETGKWEKDKSPEAQAKWYKANFDLCQLKVPNSGA